MDKGVLGTNMVTQIGIVVKDIKETSKNYAQFLGLPQPEIILTDTVDKTRAMYKGEPCVARAYLAFFKVGELLEIELIQPDEHPSTWREFLDTKGEGIHHIAFNIKDTNVKIKKLQDMDMPLIQRGEYEGGRYVYIDALKDLKVIIETLEND
ncbi:MAG: VOC family protein [Xylanivirga thermophila]|uniref:VOC family protein n=1 Tax=Xylanivirga thermophila TaxID=2496273 RepID=UPI00101C3A78|nr:VOC family protein [Xylanivirga thermophila]